MLVCSPGFPVKQFLSFSFPFSSLAQSLNLWLRATAHTHSSGSFSFSVTITTWAGTDGRTGERKRSERDREKRMPASDRPTELTGFSRRLFKILRSLARSLSSLFRQVHHGDLRIGAKQVPGSQADRQKGIAFAVIEESCTIFRRTRLTLSASNGLFAHVLKL